MFAAHPRDHVASDRNSPLPTASTVFPLSRLSVCPSVFLPCVLSFVSFPNCSEDYYGDLDLKSIRKSELLAGLQNNDETRAIASKAAASKSQRPKSAAKAEA